MKFIYIILIVGLSNSIYCQCYPDRHNTNITDSWLSCDVATNPNSANADGHWIMYDLGGIHPIHNIQLWNLNHPDFLNYGFKEVLVEYSDDGNNWTSAGIFSIPKARASSFYEGYRGIDLEGAPLQFLLLTGISNYGGPCYGLAEIKAFSSSQEINDWTFDILTCEKDGILQHLSFGSNEDGTYSGPGVTDQGDDTFLFDPDLVGAGTFNVAYTYIKNGNTKIARGTIEVLSCESRYCGDCPNCDNYLQATIDGDPVPSNIYYADSVQSMGTVRQDDLVYFRGEQQVNLEPGFEVDQAMTFVSEIRDCQTNLIMNPSFEIGFSNWSTIISSAISASITESTAEKYEGQTSAHINATSSTGQEWRLALQQNAIPLEIGEEYVLSFAVKSSHRSTINLRFITSSQLVSENLILDPYWNHYRFVFTANETSGFVKFQFGYEIGDFWLDHIRLELKTEEQ